MKNILLILQETTVCIISIVIFFSSCKHHPSISFDLTITPDTLELFAPGIISTELYERDMAISPDGNEIMYSLGTYDQSRRCLVAIVKSDQGWGNKEVVNISGVYQDIEPFYAAEGNTLFFVSDRPMPSDTTRNDYNIWKSQRVNGAWNDPVPLSDLINTTEGEYYPSLSRNGNLYFTATRRDGMGREDILVSRYVNGNYQQPEVLDTNINSATYEFNAYISPDEDVLIFSSYGREDDLGGGDLYYSVRNTDGSWTKAKNLGATINSDKLDYCPFVDYARGNFYFTSDRSAESRGRIEDTGELSRLANHPLNGMGNIYRIDMNKLRIK